MITKPIREEYSAEAILLLETGKSLKIAKYSFFHKLLMQKLITILGNK
jgi:hypothetical protein